jgi:hypothetical protein
MLRNNLFIAVTTASLIVGAASVHAQQSPLDQDAPKDHMMMQHMQMMMQDMQKMHAQMSKMAENCNKMMEGMMQHSPPPQQQK